MYKIVSSNNEIIYISNDMDNINTFISFLIEDDMRNNTVNDYTVVNG